MPYTETHEIAIGPITLPAGVAIEVATAVGTGGQQSVKIVGSTPSSKTDTIALLQQAFALLMTSASGEGVGAPVFGKDTTPPTVPGNLVAKPLSASEVDLSWDASTDNVAVAEYVVMRDGAKLASVPATATSFADTSVVTATIYEYEVIAIDTSGNASAPSAMARVTTP